MIKIISNARRSSSNTWLKIIVIDFILQYRSLLMKSTCKIACATDGIIYYYALFIDLHPIKKNNESIHFWLVSIWFESFHVHWFRKHLKNKMCRQSYFGLIFRFQKAEQINYERLLKIKQNKEFKVNTCNYIAKK